MLINIVIGEQTMRKSVHHGLHTSLRTTLIRARKNLGLSQRELAERMGITHSVIGKVETGDRRLDVIEFYEYTKALGLVPSETLFLLFYEHRGDDLRKFGKGDGI